MEEIRIYVEDKRIETNWDFETLSQQYGKDFVSKINKKLKDFQNSSKQVLCTFDEEDCVEVLMVKIKNI